MDSPLIQLIKSKNDEKSDKNGVNNKLCRYPMSERLDFYKLKMALFDNGDPEEFLLFIRKFQMTLKASGTITSGSNIQYICMLVCGEAFCQIDTLSSEVRSTTSEHLNSLFWVEVRTYPLFTRCQNKRAPCTTE